ncbi:MAG: DUF1330 domain-containing protein [Parafilimonas terrae]|nr:DUF1330 domain-containing protein [Parafilimonas terrae]
MPKGYIIVRMTVTDPDAYKDYAAMASEAMRKYGCTPLVRGGRCEALEGEARPRNVVLEFESYEAARTYYFSPEYQAAVEKRRPAGIGEVVLVEGVD